MVTLKIILGFFDKYFLYLMIIHCFLLIVIDTYMFKKRNDEKNKQKSKTFGYSFLAVSVMLFLAGLYLK